VRLNYGRVPLCDQKSKPHYRIISLLLLKLFHVTDGQTDRPTGSYLTALSRDARKNQCQYSIQGGPKSDTLLVFEFPIPTLLLLDAL